MELLQTERKSKSERAIAGSLSNKAFFSQIYGYNYNQAFAWHFKFCSAHSPRQTNQFYQGQRAETLHRLLLYISSMLSITRANSNHATLLSSKYNFKSLEYFLNLFLVDHIKTAPKKFKNPLKNDKKNVH